MQNRTENLSIAVFSTSTNLGTYFIQRITERSEHINPVADQVSHDGINYDYVNLSEDMPIVNMLQANRDHTHNFDFVYLVYDTSNKETYDRLVKKYS